MECKICGTVYDESTAENLDCNCGCSGDLVLCPNCGYAVKIPGPKKKKSFAEKITSMFRMGY